MADVPTTGTGPECNCDYSPERGHSLGCALVGENLRRAQLAAARERLESAKREIEILEGGV